MHHCGTASGRNWLAVQKALAALSMLSPATAEFEGAKQVSEPWTEPSKRHSVAKMDKIYPD